MASFIPQNVNQRVAFCKRGHDLSKFQEVLRKVRQIEIQQTFGFET